MNTRRYIFILVLAAICGCSKPPSPPPPASPPLTTKSYPIGSPFQLTLSFPATWKDEVPRFVEYQSNSTSTYDGIRFTPTNAERCVFQIVLIPLIGTNMPLPDLKSSLLKGSQNDLSNAVESALKVRDLGGTNVPGCYYRLTDRTFSNAPPSATNFKYLTQGLANLGPLTLSFRLVDDDVTSETEALNVIRSARITRQ